MPHVPAMLLAAPCQPPRTPALRGATAVFSKNLNSEKNRGKTRGLW